ncbi:hypothetical protein [Kitasatospora sp. GP82]|uniref:hypothetical protein n=1 Tax=Kitasatospora sp. GP82 TaxID=3035089 RepID=UPI002474EF7B|nr:hypothetical protein [Kitasatospora sp. GP82]MDH6129389.1 putative Zn-binding protein involved in type VI secretion [Kitasatospora sp. GP82]
MPVIDHPVLRVLLLLFLACLLILLMLPVTRRSSPIRALRAAALPWLPEAREGHTSSPHLPRRVLGGAVVVGIACFTIGGDLTALLGFVLAAAGVLLYGI